MLLMTDDQEKHTFHKNSHVFDSIKNYFDK